MKRRAFDLLTSVIGLGLAVLLFVAGGLLTWAHTFVGNEVHKELSNQQIVFPKTTDPGFTALQEEVSSGKGPATAADVNAMRKYAGQKMVNGAQAEVWADHYIAVHLKSIGGGKTYNQLSGELLGLKSTDPNYGTLSATVDTVFKGETLRGLLLNAYAFGTVGDIAGIAATVAYVGGGVLLILAGLGLMHSQRTREDDEILVRHEHIAPTSV